MHGGDTTTRTHPAAAPAATAVGAGLVVIALGLAVGLPATYTAAHWSLAWVGLDLASAAAALATAALLRRGDRRVALAASVTATLLALDAWFDVCTAASVAEHGVAVAEAVLVELPLAGLAARLAWTSSS